MPSRSNVTRFNTGIRTRTGRTYRPVTGRQAVGYAGTSGGNTNAGLARSNTIEHAVGTANALNNAARANGTYGPGNRAFVRATRGGGVSVEFS